MRQIALPLALASALTLAACAETTDTEPGEAATQSAAATTDDAALTEPPAAATAPPGTPAPDGDRTLALESLGDLRVGQPIPAGSKFAERGAQIGEECRTVSSPDFPGVYAITRGKGGPVRRISVGQRSDVKLAEGIGIGASEQAVVAAFPGFRSTPHKYVDAPAKYLDQPGSDPRLRFEIDASGKVSLVHVGLMPELGFVEGCA